MSVEETGKSGSRVPVLEARLRLDRADEGLAQVESTNITRLQFGHNLVTFH